METNKLHAELYQSIPDYFANKCILITGATGFLGKTLLEKLLRSCPNIGKIYILVRSKKNKSPQERWNKILENELFDKLKETNQSALNKVIVIEGDVNELDLGISLKDKKELIDNVSIVYHSAATIRYLEEFRKAILLNVRGTREICKLVLQLKKVSMFMHISTCFCQIGSDPLEERLYPARGNPYEIIEIAETMDSEILKQITLKYIEGFPNTYTFTKCVSETLVKDMCEGKVPTIVYRPAIVTPASEDPICGWVDNLNGPLTACLASMKGVIRTLPMDDNVKFDYCPVDAVIRGIIKATWHQSTIKDTNIAVFNCSNTNCYEYSLTDHKNSPSMLMSRELWCKPFLEFNVWTNPSLFIFWVRLYWYQFIPAILVDVILKLLGKKSLALKNLVKMVTVLNTVKYFGLRQFTFVNKKFLALDNFLSKEDDDNFNNCMSLLDKDDYIVNCMINICKLINDVDMSGNYKSMKRRNYIYFVWNTIWRIIFGVGIYNYILQPIYCNCMDYLISL